MPESAISVLHLSTFDRQGGAARAAFRLHRALREIGVRSQMGVQVKSSDDPSIIAPASRLARLRHEFIATIDRVPLALYRRRAAVPFDVQWIGSCPLSAVSRLRPDIVHLHWVTGGFVRIESLKKLALPLVWTLCDMWPFTGGCHVSGDCENYRAKCGSCWQLDSDSSRDLTHWVWRRKERAWRGIDLNLVAPSTWMAECARSSSLFREQPITVIANGLDTDIFRPIDKQSARHWLGIEQDRRIVLFGAVDPVGDHNKGFELLIAAMKTLRELLDEECCLVIFGCSEPAEPPRLNFGVRYMGYLNDEIALGLLYNAADVMIVPSLQESFCQTAAEALACGTPVVAFDSTGLRDVVDHKLNGYLARSYDVQDLANGLLWVLKAEAPDEMSRSARQKAVEDFAIKRTAQLYRQLYDEVQHRPRAQVRPRPGP